MPKKKFFDKRKSVSFHLVHRSQQDPLAADETAPQHVLVPINNPKILEKNKEEEKKYGIYFDDDYNYLQHLRELKSDVIWTEIPSYSKVILKIHYNLLNNKPQKPTKLNLPSSVFPSEIEENVGLLNKAAPCGLNLDLDPDVVAAMDEDFNYDDSENELEDNFVELANGCTNNSEDEDLEDNCEYEMDDDLASLEREETKSKFTEYSMTSSVLTRNSQLTLLDEKFEQMFAEYSDNEIGALNCEDIEGDIDTDSSLFKLAIQEFDHQNRDVFKETMSAPRVNYLPDSSDNESTNGEFFVEVKGKEKWDCESVLSSYSNLYNHPQLIKDLPINKIRINKKTGIPIETTKLTKKSLAQLDSDNKKNGTSSVISRLSILSVRDKNESTDQKHDRKKQIREYRRARRIEKKANAEAFKEEKKKLEKSGIGNKVRCQGLRL